MHHQVWFIHKGPLEDPLSNCPLGSSGPGVDIESCQQGNSGSFAPEHSLELLRSLIHRLPGGREGERSRGDRVLSGFVINVKCPQDCDFI